MTTYQVPSDASNMTQNFRLLESRSQENSEAIENINLNIHKYCSKGCQYVQTNITSKKRYRSCLELLKCGFNESGRYIVEHSSGYKREVFCDQSSDGGGWTVFLRNRYGNISFYKRWEDYKNGFGDLDYDFWLGNEFLFRTTTLYNFHESNTTQLYISLVDKANTTFYVKYNNFAVLSETNRYRLHISGHLYGTAGDSLEYHNNAAFSTKDRDFDTQLQKLCRFI